MAIHINELIRLHGDQLREMSNSDYAELAHGLCGDSPAITTAVKRAGLDPETRFTNVMNYRVLRHLHSLSTGEMAEVDCSGLDLF